MYIGSIYKHTNVIKRTAFNRDTSSVLSVLKMYIVILSYSTRHTESAMVTATSEVVQQLQQDLSKRNMLFSKDHIQLYKVIGQGKISKCGMYSTRFSLIRTQKGMN